MTHDMLAPLVVGALAMSIVAFAWQYRKALASTRSTTYAPPRGDVRQGVLYAFTSGMDPRRKDGVRRHPGVALAGAVFHVGIGACLLVVALLLSGGTLSSASSRVAFAALLTAAAAAGVALYIRRARSPMLAAISRPDDYASNALVVMWLAATAAATLRPALLPVAALLTVALLLYAPFGKIRHCVFFFPARLQYGRFLGRRGVVGGTHQAR